MYCNTDVVIIEPVTGKTSTKGDRGCTVTTT